MTRSARLRAATARLAGAGIAEPGRDARLLLRWAARLGPEAMAGALEAEPSPEEIARFDAAVTRRAGRCPLSHITGQRAFWQHDFAVTPDVLDPRPETEALVAWALEGAPARRVLDLGTGSGCILLSLLAAWPDAEGLGIDASAAALTVARANAEALGIARRVHLAEGDWLAGVYGRFDLVVSNPPYLATDELADLAPEVAAEPVAALDGGRDGLSAYRAIAADLSRVLAPGGAALVEIGPTQAETVAALFAARGFTAELRHDLDGRPRVLRFCRPDGPDFTV